MPLAIVDYRFWWRTNAQGAGPQRLEFIDLVEVNFLGAHLF